MKLKWFIKSRCLVGPNEPMSPEVGVACVGCIDFKYKAAVIYRKNKHYHYYYQTIYKYFVLTLCFLNIISYFLRSVKLSTISLLNEYCIVLYA